MLAWIAVCKPNRCKKIALISHRQRGDYKLNFRQAKPPRLPVIITHGGESLCQSSRSLLTASHWAPIDPTVGSTPVWSVFKLWKPSRCPSSSSSRNLLTSFQPRKGATCPRSMHRRSLWRLHSLIWNQSTLVCSSVGEPVARRKWNGVWISGEI